MTTPKIIGHLTGCGELNRRIRNRHTAQRRRAEQLQYLSQFTPPPMNAATLTAAQADAALKPYGYRVTPWLNSRTKLCVFRGDHGGETMLKSKVAELIELQIELHQQYS